MKTTQVNVAIDEKTKAALAKAAKAKKVSVGWIVREAIDRYLAEPKAA
jgi:predicted HicB family RNase H-like nuclease